MTQSLQDEMRQAAARIEQALDCLLSPEPTPGEQARPERLLAAMRHGVLNGGKRIRPFLVLQTAGLFGVRESDAMNAACALEAVHCYSLIHDDLPAMDDDDLRRGQPTVHKAFDEATAILAGDALLTLAFDWVTADTCHADASIRANLANLLAKASGLGGMIGGQMLDIAAETDTPNEAGIRQLQAMKTGALIRFACEAGAVLGKADETQRQALVSYGETIGLAFQLADDLLDVTASTQDMGKATGKDADKGKGTLVAIYGEAKVRVMLDELVEQATGHLASFGDKANTLRDTARYVVERKN